MRLLADSPVLGVRLQRMLPLGLFGLAVLLRLIYRAQAGANPLLHVPMLDEAHYLDYARELADGNWLGEAGAYFMDPLYAYLLAGLIVLFGDGAAAMRFVQILAEGGTVLLLFAIGRCLWSWRAGAVAGVLYALYPPAWFYSLTILKASLTTAWLVLVVWAGLRAAERPRVWAWTVVGALAGAGMLLRSYMTIAMALLPVLIWLGALGDAGLWRRQTGALLLGAALALAPVALRNWVAVGEFAVLPQQSGTVLYSSNHPGNAEGGYAPPDFIHANHPARMEQQFRAEAEGRMGHAMTSREVSAYWRGQALQWWFSSPGVLPRLLWKRLGHLLGRAEIPNNQSLALAAEYAPMLVPALPVFSVLLALGIPGLALGLAGRRRAWVLLVPVAVVTVTSLVFYACGRFRLPMVPMLALGAGYLLAEPWWRAYSWLPRAGWGLVTASLLGVSLSIPAPAVDLSMLYLNLANAHARLRELDQARAWLARHPTQQGADYWQARGFIQLVGKDNAAARSSFARALALAPQEPDLVHNLALATMGEGHPAQAAEMFGLAWRLSGDPRSRYWHGVALQRSGAVQQARVVFEALLEEPRLGALRPKVEAKLRPDSGRPTSR